MSKLGRYVGKVVLINIPGNRRPRYRWIVKRRADGRFIVRTPKNGVLIRNLDYKNNYDYGPAHLLPKRSTLYQLKW